MKKIINFMMLLALVTIVGLGICNVNSSAALNQSVKAATATGKSDLQLITTSTKLKKPQIGSWKRATVNAYGVSYKIKWKKVSGASGYQVKYYERECAGDSWWSMTKMTSHTYFGTSFSDLYQIKAKVRAYKKVNGRKIYGPWSACKVKTLY